MAAQAEKSERRNKIKKEFRKLKQKNKKHIEKVYSNKKNEGFEKDSRIRDRPFTRVSVYKEDSIK